MRILPNISLVGSGDLGFSLTDPYDSHVYLLEGDNGSVLIDAGSGRDIGAIIDNVVGTVGSAQHVEHILLTHAHFDHSGGAAALAKELDAKIYASRLAAEALVAGDEQAIGLTAARRAGIYPSDVVLTPTPVSEVLVPGSIRLDGISIQVIATPGHSGDHLCFVVDSGDDRVIFSGDAVFARGRLAILGRPDASIASLKPSMERLVGCSPTVLLPGHGEIVLNRAVDTLETALDALRVEQLPPPFLP